MLSLLDIGETYAWFHGEDDEGNDVYVYVEDMGQPGSDPGDSIKIWYDTSPMSSPSYEGDLGECNIQVH